MAKNKLTAKELMDSVVDLDLLKREKKIVQVIRKT